MTPRIVVSILLNAQRVRLRLRARPSIDDSFFSRGLPLLMFAISDFDIKSSPRLIFLLL